MRLLRRAFEIANAEQPSPNPRVGAVLAKGGRIIAEGAHRKAGGPHAEIIALRKAGKRARGATLYLTQEPCSHQGRTPPCVGPVVRSGVKQVIVGMIDPNPIVAGKGITQLRAAGINVAVFPRKHPLAMQINEMNRAWIKRITTGIPYVTMKVAQSLDGKICTFTGDSQWISGEESRQYVHELRAKVDAVMVGIGTVLKDNPQLTARRGKNFTLRKSDRQPMRIIVDPQLAIPLHAQVLANTGAMVCCNYGADPDKHRALKDKGTTILEFNTVTIKKILQELGKREINHVLIEGGAGIYTQALEEQVVDEILCFIAPKLIGGKNAKTMFDGQGMAAVVDAVELKNISVQHMGGDLMVKGNIVREATHHVQ